MHGVNLMLISRVPAYFDRYGKISTDSGLLNTFTYIGSGISGFRYRGFVRKIGLGRNCSKLVCGGVFGKYALRAVRT